MSSKQIIRTLVVCLVIAVGAGIFMNVYHNSNAQTEDKESGDQMNTAAKKGVDGVKVTDSFTPDQRAALEDMMRDFIMDNPELILQSVQNMQEEQQRQAEEQQRANLSEYRDDLVNNEDLPSVGSPDADVTVVEFFDYNCGYCRKALEEVVKLINEMDKETLRVVFVDYPILGPTSVTAAKWALAADDQGKYFEYHMAVMNDKGDKTPARLRELAKELGLDVEKLAEDASSEKIQKRIEKNIDIAGAIGIRGTPGFLIGEQLVPGYVSYQQMRDMVEAAKEKGGDEDG